MDVVRMYKDLNHKPCETMAQAYTRGHKAGREETLDECLKIVVDNESGCGNEWVIREEIKQLKEQKN